MKILSFIISMIFGIIFAIGSLSHESIKSFEWIGIAVGIGTLIFVCQTHKEKIDKLEKEIEELKKNKL